MSSSPHPLIDKKNGCGHLSSRIRKHSHNGGGHPSPFRCLLKGTSFFCFHSEGGLPSPHTLKKKKKTGRGHLFRTFRKSRMNGGGHSSPCFTFFLQSVCFFLKLGRGEWRPPHFLKKQRQKGGGHLPIPFRKTTKNGGGNSITTLEAE